MIVPEFWAEARRRYRSGGRRLTVRRFGWSDASPDDARAMAEARVEEALRAVLAGEGVARREPKVPYNGADGMPIREEILARHGDAVVTRNSYGARCLNTPDVLFADVDFDVRVPAPWWLVAVGLVGVVAVGTGLIVACAGGPPEVSVPMIAAGVLVMLLGDRLDRYVRTPSEVAETVRDPFRGMSFGVVRATTVAEAVQAVRDHVRGFLDAHPDWNVRLYRTPAGLRMLVTHRPFSPDDEAVAELFRAIEADPVYVRMCRNQKCFRARLTAKPWRIGIDEHLKPRPGVWPVRPERLPDRIAWVAAYEERAAGFAACRFLEAIGSGIVHPKVVPVVALHDAECRANDPDRPLA